MAEPAPLPAAGQPDQTAEVERLTKINRALMDRAERSTSVQASHFSLFQTTVTLEEQVRRRTSELEAALRENELINRALRESEAKFHGLVNQSLVGIVIIEEGTFTYSNAKFDEMFGYSSDEVRQLGPLDMAIEDDRPLIAENVRKRPQGEVEHADYVFRGRRKDGGVVDIEVHSSAMDIGGKMLLIDVRMAASWTSRSTAARWTSAERCFSSVSSWTSANAPAPSVRCRHYRNCCAINRHTTH